MPYNKNLIIEKNFARYGCMALYKDTKNNTSKAITIVFTEDTELIGSDGFAVYRDTIKIKKTDNPSDDCLIEIDGQDWKLQELIKPGEIVNQYIVTKANNEQL